MDSEKIINGAVKFILAFGLTLFLLIKGWLGSSVKVEIDGRSVVFYKVYQVEDDPRENYFFKKRLYREEDIAAYVQRIGGILYYLSEEKRLCPESEASYVAVKLENAEKK